MSLCTYGIVHGCMKYDHLVLFELMSAPPSCTSYCRSTVCFLIECTILSDCCGDLWISGHFPSNFTEGDASRATSSPVVGPTISAAASLDPLQGTVKDVTRKGGVHKENNRLKKLRKTDEVLYECLETGAVRGKGNEPDLLSGDESSSDDDEGMNLKLPSSSGTTHSNAEEGDSEGEKSVNSKEREDADGEDMEEEDVVKFPTLKSYDPQFISPQKPLRVKVAQDDHANASVQEIVAPTMVSLHESMKTNDAGEDQSKNTAAVEVPGSECLEGRNPKKKDGTPIVEAGDDIREAAEDKIFKTPEETAEKTSEKSPVKKKMKAVKNVPESEGRQAPSKSPAGLGRVMTRSQEKLQPPTQAKKRKKRRAT